MLPCKLVFQYNGSCVLRGTIVGKGSFGLWVVEGEHVIRIVLGRCSKIISGTLHQKWVVRVLNGKFTLFSYIVDAFNNL